MSLLEVEAKLAGLTQAEKGQLMQRLVGEFGLASAGIEKSPDVAGGDARLVGTRIPIWLLENYRRAGLSEAQILANYPALHAADLVSAWIYVEANLDEINEAIQANEMA